LKMLQTLLFLKYSYNFCLFALLLLLSNSVQCTRLGFVIGQENRTAEFFEDIQKSTFVLVNYTAVVIGDASGNNLNSEADKINIEFSVNELDISDEVIHTTLKQKGTSEGRFFFTTAQTGSHKLVFSTARAFADGKSLPAVKIEVEFLFDNAGDPEVISHTEADLGRLQGFVHHLIDEANIIKREQERLSLREIDYED
jgi:hypothetical protein